MKQSSTTNFLTPQGPLQGLTACFTLFPGNLSRKGVFMTTDSPIAKHLKELSLR